ncbi:hypothetical protein NE237_027704 [Protea cynaroides]|uniref:protein-serine/threonine phosphatase n=1 Tax=Protea cynaroides TaxID=273540 RepID=A0A9Q0GN02_9MAGN|nr:hypothetical protein NE237_027704 [Protea cynaroides]
MNSGGGDGVFRRMETETSLGKSLQLTPSSSSTSMALLPSIISTAQQNQGNLTGERVINEDWLDHVGKNQPIMNVVTKDPSTGEMNNQLASQNVQQDPITNNSPSQMHHHNPKNSNEFLSLPPRNNLYHQSKCWSSTEPKSLKGGSIGFHASSFGSSSKVLAFRPGLRDLRWGLDARLGAEYPLSYKFRALKPTMVDTSATDERGTMVDVLPGKENMEDNGCASEGWGSEDGRLSCGSPKKRGRLNCGYSSFRGKRASMEDFYDVKMSTIDGQTVSLFGIFDGHGGSRAAEYLKEHLFENLLKHPKFMTDTKLAISETYQRTDMDFLDAESNTYRDDGSTASTAVLVGNHLYVANVGDSRAVISKAGKAIPLSEDHKPNRSDERKRIESAGGVVMWAGTWRVGGVLAMSRAFGNRLLKQFVVAEPEIQELEIDDEVECLVLASDGLWDVVPNEDAVSLAIAEEEPGAAARRLTDTAYTRGSADNITCIVVRFNHDKAE